MRRKRIRGAKAGRRRHPWLKAAMGAAVLVFLLLFVVARLYRLYR